MSEWSYEPVVWNDVWRRGEWLITRHPQRDHGWYVVRFKGEPITMKDSLVLAKRFVERQMA